MARKRKDKVVAGEKTPEYLEFEALGRKILSVPKTELDRRGQEERSKKGK